MFSHVISTEAYECMRSGEIPQTKSDPKVSFRPKHTNVCEAEKSPKRSQDCVLVDFSTALEMTVALSQDYVLVDFSTELEMTVALSQDCVLVDFSAALEMTGRVSRPGFLPFSIKNSNCTPHLQL